jgi:hypothetical protein
MKTAEETPIPQSQTDKVVGKLSQERLTKYVERAHGDHEVALKLYVWNHEIGAALSFLLQQFEVCLRNSVAKALVDCFDGSWHNNTGFLNRNKDIADLSATARKRAEEDCGAREVTASDFIAAATLSFWREVCKPGWVGEIWSKRLPLSFPNMELKKNKRENLDDLHKKLNNIVNLRNRIAHHEPIIGYRYEHLARKLEDRHREIFEVLNWMDTDFAMWVKSHDRFHEVLAICPVSRDPILTRRT